MDKFEIILIIVLVIVVLFFGAKKLPELARGVGQSAKELKKGFRDGLPEDEVADTKTTKKTTKKS
jgi:sec-independent protein translocase protein TatA